LTRGAGGSPAVSLLLSRLVRNRYAAAAAMKITVMATASV
jgi:hypothetical protein